MRIGTQCICGSSPPSGQSVTGATCSAPCSGNPTECCGSGDNACVYYNPSPPSSSSVSKSIIQYTTTDSQGSVYTMSSTSTITTASLPSTSVVTYATTDSQGSVYTTSSTSTQGRSVTVYTTTNSYGSVVTTSSTATLPPVPSSSTSMTVYTTTNSYGSVVTTSSTTTIPPAPSSSTSSSVIIYTTTSGTSTYVTSSTSVTTKGPSQYTGVTTQTNTYTSTDKHGSTITSTSTSVGTTTVTSSTASASPICPAQNGGTYSDVNGVVYNVYCGVDFPYNDLPAVHTDNVYDCMAACDAYVPNQNVAKGAACIAAVYGEGNPGGNCYLKYTITTVNPNAMRFVGLKKVSYTPTSAPSYVPSTTPTYATSDDHASSYTPPPVSTGGGGYGGGGGSGTTSSPPPYNGGGAGGGSGTASSPPPYNGGGGGGGSQQTTPTTSSTRLPLTVTTSSRSSASVDASLAPSPCPAGDGQPYICSTGTVYAIHCGVDFQYYDLEAVRTETFSACIEACAAYVPDQNIARGLPCVGSSWGGLRSTGENCYLKYNISEVVYRSNVCSCNRHDYPIPAISSIPQPQQSTTYSAGGGGFTSSPAGYGGGGGPVSSTSTPAGYGGGGGGAGTTSSTSTTRSSTSTPVGYGGGGGGSGTTSSTWTPAGYGGGGGGATTSSTSTPVGYGGGGYGGASTSTTSTPAGYGYGGGGGPATSAGASSPIPTLTRTPDCPADNNTRYTDALGITYDVRCGLDLAGNNAQPAHADTWPECLEFCALLGDCAGVTFQNPGSPASIANCYPYSSITSYAPARSGIYNGVPVNGPTPINAAYNSGDVCQPNSNGTYTDAFGKTYITGCDQQVPGGPSGTDLKSTALRTLKACLTYCTHYDTCIGVDFSGYPVSSNAGNCYPKFSPILPALPAQGTSFAIPA